ncbi:MAG: DegV family protein [Candidatus Limnocylindrales bacterium]|jgi:DegV family protein with EDD domain
MPRVAIVVDSASDLSPEDAAKNGIATVPLLVTFGTTEFRTGIDLSTERFWDMMIAPGAPFPKTAACSPGDFQTAFQQAFDAGAESIVCITVGDKLSGTNKSAHIAAEQTMAGRDIRIIDSETASYGFGLLAIMASEMAGGGAGADEIAATVERRKADSRLYVVLETLEYLKRGGRISAARAAIGGVLSVKPIITIEHGEVETADTPRTRGKARERLVELLTAKPIERAVVLEGRAPDADAFATELATRAALPAGSIPVRAIGPSVGPHVGPGAYGAVVIYRA